MFNLSKRTIGSLLTAAALLFGGGFALGVKVRTDFLKQSAPSSVTEPLAGFRAVAKVTDVSSPGVYQLQAHVWTNQFVNTTVCIGDVAYDARQKPLCNILAETSTSGAWVRGQLVTIFNIRSLGAHVQDVPFVLSAPAKGRDVFSGPVTGQVVSLLDADTFRTAVEIWPGHHLLTDVRVLKIDTPEKGGRADCPQEAALSVQASDEARRLLKGRQVTLKNIKPDKFGGRVLAEVTTEAGVDLAGHLVQKGFARAYDGGAKSSWCVPSHSS